MVENQPIFTAFTEKSLRILVLILSKFHLNPDKIKAFRCPNKGTPLSAQWGWEGDRRAGEGVRNDGAQNFEEIDLFHSSFALRLFYSNRAPRLPSLSLPFSFTLIKSRIVAIISPPFHYCFIPGLHPSSF